MGLSTQVIQQEARHREKNTQSPRKQHTEEFTGLQDFSVRKTLRFV